MSTATQENLGEEQARAMRSMVESLATLQSGRVYSPRIKMLSVDQVTEAVGVAPSTIYQLIEQGEFPKPYKIGRKNSWRESQIIAWLDRQDPNRGAEWNPNKTER